MKGKSLWSCVGIVLLNMFLFIPIIYFPPVFGPLHILNFWLSFDHVVKSDWFRFSASSNLFAIIPIIGQFLVVLWMFTPDSKDISVWEVLLEPWWILTMYLTIGVLEFFILRGMLLKYERLKKDMPSEA